ncbi:hypothetical protein DF052_26570 [Burkholderia glumae]|nr:hypothetical protein DF052_26570 [Burkholderia glumae]
MAVSLCLLDDRVGRALQLLVQRSRVSRGSGFKLRFLQFEEQIVDFAGSEEMLRAHHVLTGHADNLVDQGARLPTLTPVFHFENVSAPGELLLALVVQILVFLGTEVVVDHIAAGDVSRH